jgi:hypothetical protein
MRYKKAQSSGALGVAVSYVAYGSRTLILAALFLTTQTRTWHRPDWSQTLWQRLKMPSRAG